MSKTTITYLIVGFCGVAGIAALHGTDRGSRVVGLQQVWQRVAATFLSLYVLAGLVVLGTGLGLLVVLLWDRVF